MDINAQIKILEALLKLEENKECADCYSKTPRWASTTFGTFVCLRCSGKHRELQVHITKVKSVNLDKWKPEMVEMYKTVNNLLLNCYWEARMPAGYQKPNQNTSPEEVMRFIKEKYLTKRWIDLDAKSDLASLYWSDKKKFEKQKEKYLTGASRKNDDDEEEDQESSEDEEDRKRRKKEKKEKKKAKKEREEKERQEQERSKQQSKLAKPPSQQQSKPIEDLIGFDSIQTKTPAQNLIDDFSDFQDGQGKTHAVNNQNDGFSDFQGAGGQQQQVSQGQNTQPTLNIQNLYNMYNQNPSFASSQNPANNKYSALDALGHIGGPAPQQQQLGMGMQMGYPGNMYPQGVGASQGLGFQQPNQPMGYGAVQPMGGFQPMAGGFGQQQPMQQRPDPFGQNSGQTNMFAGMNMTINVNQYGAGNQFGQSQPGFQSQPQYGAQMNQPGFKPQQQPYGQGNLNLGAPQNPHAFHHQHSAPTLHQHNQQKAVPGGQQSNLYGGLVDLNNLASSGNNGNFNSSGAFGYGPQGGQQQQKKDAFSGLLNGQF